MQTQTRTTILDGDMAAAGSQARAVRVATTWREPMLRGILAIAVGLVLFAFPVSAALVVAIAFGVFVLVDGAFAIVHASRNAHPDAGRWWALLARGVLGVLVGLFAILFPTAAAAALGTLIAIFAIVAGGLEIASGFRIRHDVPRETTLVALGILTVVLGIVLLFAPFIALIAQIWIVAAYAIILGVGMITYSMQLRRRAVAYRAGAVTKSPDSL